MISLGAGAHASKHQAGGEDEIDTTGLVGRLGFVPRPDPGEYDFETDDFTYDADWHDLDLSGIIPAGAKVAIIHVRVQMVVDVQHLDFMGYAALGTWTTQRCYPQDGAKTCSHIVVLPLDSARVILYTSNNATLNVCWFTVAGWFI